MKKLYILLLGFAFACNAFAQQSASVPVPADPDGMFFEWYDYTPYTWPNGEVTVASGWFYLTYGMDLYNNLVANDYDISIDSCIVHELNYTILDREKFSYSIYTDMDASRAGMISGSSNCPAGQWHGAGTIEWGR